MDIEEKVLELLVRICGTKKVYKDLSLNLIEEGYLDSMGIVTLISEIEDEFEVEVELDNFDINDFSTANKIIAFLKNYTVTEI